MPSSGSAKKARPEMYALVDCDNFFVSCERVFRPDLWRTPMVVLSNNDGCIVARSREVKAMPDIPMGVPVFKVAKLLTERGVQTFSANFGLYGDFSRRVVSLLQQAAPRVEVYSVDESFLEISSLAIDNYDTWARDLRSYIGRCLGIPVSIGVAPTKTLAKLAAEQAKRNMDSQGVCVVGSDAARIALLQSFAVDKVWGVGWRTAPKLANRGVKTAYDLSLTSDAWAQQQLTRRGLQTVQELRGEPQIVFDDQRAPQQTMAVTRTFAKRLYKLHEIEAQVARFTARAGQKLRHHKQTAASVMVFVTGDRHRDGEKYRQVSYVVPLVQPSNDTGVLLEAALQALAMLYDPDFSYRRAGVVLLELGSEDARQLSWLSPQQPADLERRQKLMQAVDAINTKYHTRIIRHAVEPTPGSLPDSVNRSPAYTALWGQIAKV